MSEIRKAQFAEDTLDEDLDNLYDSLPAPGVKVEPLPPEEVTPQQDAEVRSFFGGIAHGAGAVIDDISTGIGQAPRYIERGVVGGFEGVAQFGEDISRALDSPVLQLVDEQGNFNLELMSQSALDAKFGGDAPGLEELIGKLKLDPAADPAFTAQAIEGVTKFLIGFKGVDKLFKGVKALPAASGAVQQVAAATTKGALADMLVFEAQEERLSNLIETVPALQNPVTAYLAADPADSFAEAKFKQVLEGLGLGLIADSLGAGVRVLRDGKGARPPISKEAYDKLARVKKQVLKSMSFSDAVNSGVAAAAKKEQTQAVLTGALQVGGRVAAGAAKGFSQKAAKLKDDLVTRVYGDAPAAFDQEKVLKSAGLVDDPLISDMMRFASEQTPKTKLSWDKTNAKALGMTLEDAQARFGTAGEFTAAIGAVKNEAIVRAARLSESISLKGLDDPASIEAFAQFLEVSSIEKMMSGEAGRALNSLKQTKSVAEVLGSLDAISKNQLEAAIKGFSGDPERLLSFGRQLGRSRAADVKAGIHSYWINSVLSGPVTHITNLTSNVAFLALRPVERLGASGVGLLKGGDRALARESLEMYHGFYEGFRDAIRVLTKSGPVDEALQAVVKRGTKFDDIGDVSAERGNMLLHKAITGREQKLSRKEFLAMGPKGMGLELLGRSLTAPTDFLGASDQFLKTMAARGEKRALAFRSAMDDGLEGEAFDARMKAILSNSPLDAADTVIMQNINEAAGAFARQTVFQEELGAAGQAIINLRDQVPLMGYVVPFVKTPLNILDETFLKRTPVGLASARVRGEILGGGVRAHEAVAKMAIGTGVSGMIAAAYSTGNITGAGPKNKAARERWLETHQPWSVRVGDKWYAYNRIEPIGSLIGLGARLAEVIEHTEDVNTLDPEEQEELVFGVAGAFSKYVTDKSFLAGVDNVLSAIEGDEYALEQLAANILGGFVPYSAAVRTVNSAENKELRDMDGILERIQGGLPGLSEQLPHRRNRFGDKIIGADRVLGMVLPISHTPGGVADKKTQRINEIELEAGVILSKPSNKFRGIELSTAEQDARLETLRTFQMRGVGVKDAIIATADREEYQSIPSTDKGGKGEIVKRIYRNYLKASDELFLLQHPEISVRVEAALIGSFTDEREINPRTGEPRVKETFVGAE